MKRSWIRRVSIFMLLSVLHLAIGLPVLADDPPPPEGVPEAVWHAYLRELEARRAAGDVQFIGASPHGQVGAAAVVTLTGRVIDQFGTGVPDAQILGNLNLQQTFIFPSRCPAGSGIGTATPTVSPTVTRTPTNTPIDTPTHTPTPTSRAGAFTGADGSFSIGLASGEWNLFTNKFGYYRSSSANNLTVQVSEVPTGPVTVTLYLPDRVIAGRLTDSNGAPLPDDFMNSIFVSGRRTISTSTGTQNEFYFAPTVHYTATGAYSVPVILGDWRISASRFDSGDLSVIRDNIPATSPMTTTVDLSLIRPTGAIMGVVQDTAGRPISQTSLFGSLAYSTATPFAQGAFTSATSLPDGTYTLPVIPGNWNLSASKFGYISPSSLQVAGPAANQNVILIERVNCIQGQVVSPSGSPVPGASIIGRGRVPNVPSTYFVIGQADEAGNYALPVGPSDTWSVFASAAGFSASISQTVSVPPDRIGVDLRLQAPHGSVTPTPTATASASPTVTGSPGFQIFVPLVTRASPGW